MLTVGSLFSGIGGLDLGLERAGMRVLWQCEADPYCRAVLRKHWPDIPCYEDVRTLMADPEGIGRDNGAASDDRPTAADVNTPGDSGGLRRVDVLCGGFPCQPFSSAGKRMGTADRRWLWPEFARLIRLLQPRYVLVENVPGLLVRGMGNVLGDLAGCGYDAEWQCFPAAAVGAPHLRYRIFIVAYTNEFGRPRGSDTGSGKGLGISGHEPARGGAEGYGGALADPDRRRRESGSSRPSERGLSEPDTSREMAHARRRRHGAPPRQILPGRYRAKYSDWWSAEPAVGRVADGLPHRVDQLRGLGNAVVPQVAEVIGRMIVEAEHLA